MNIRMKGHQIQVDPNKIAVYVRWSTDDQATGTTLQIQTEKCQEWLNRRGLPYRDEMLYVDDGYSGGNMDRPALTRLREAVTAGRLQVVVVYKLDRLSRSVMDAVNLVMGEWDGKCTLQSTVEEIDTSTQQGKQIFYMLTSFAEWERAMIRDRTYEGKLKRAQQGMNAGQKYPLGYKVDEEHLGPGKKFALDGIDRKTKKLTGKAALVRDIFDQFLGGRSLSAIAHQLNERSVPCPEKGRYWRFGDIARILDNPKYCGRYEYGRTPEAVPIYKIDEAVPAIVTLGEWEMCQAIRREQAAKQSRERVKTEPTSYLLSGIARCAQCGERIGGCRGKNKQYYVCTGTTILKKCNCAAMDKEIVEKAVVDAIRDLVTIDNLMVHVEKTRDYIRKQQELATQDLSRARNEVNSLLLQAERIEKDYRGGELKASDYYRFKDQIAKDQKDAQKRLTGSEAKHSEVMKAEVDSDYLEAMAQDLRTWESLPFERMKRILMDIIGDLRIYQAKSFVKGRGMSNENDIILEITPRTDKLEAAAVTVSAEQ